jgi:hypothetical protein
MRKTFDDFFSTAYCELQLLILKVNILCLTFMKEDDEIIEQGKKQWEYHQSAYTLLKR